MENQVIRILAASLRPTTLAAAIANLRENDQETEGQQEIADVAALSFEQVLAGMVGEAEATEMINDEMCGIPALEGRKRRQAIGKG